MTTRMPTRRRRWLIALGVVALLLAAARWYIGPLPLRPGTPPDAPATLAAWPWPGARVDHPHPGVTRWTARDADGTDLYLLQFDFAANPGLRLELYDQDEDDAAPFDDHVVYWPRGVGQVTRHLNARGRGRVVAAWNGLFFGYDSSPGKTHDIARHVAPVVLNGTPRYFVGNHRWTVGVQYRNQLPTFRALHLPDRQTLARAFTYAAAGAECLVRDGQPLRLQPFPKPGDPPLPQPVPSTPADAGHVPGVDHMRTSRTSMGWSRDSRRFYLLIIKEPDSEGASAIALRRRIPLRGGWTVADLQRFWRAHGAWGAVNIDGGEVTQAVWLRPDGRYTMIPPRYDSHAKRLTFTPDFHGAPAGGTLMYFYIRDAGR